MSEVVAKLLSSKAARLKTARNKEPISFGEEVKALRLSLELSQEAFCRKFNIPIANLRNWEQGRSSQPDSASQLLIQMIKVDPKRVEDLVAKATALKK